MDFEQLIFLIKSDLYRGKGATGLKSFVKNLFFTKNFKICFLYRICHYLYKNNNKFLLNFFKLFFAHYKTKYCIDLYVETEIDGGLYLGHLYGIVINPKAKIGKNTNISQGVTVGQLNRGKNKGCPTIGNNVFIGPNACILGNIIIGNYVSVGANSVVTKDIPDNAVVVGSKNEIISYEGSEGYVNYVDSGYLL